MAETESTSPAEQTLSDATVAERLRIKANQERYDARVGGASSAELNEEARQKAAEAAGEPEVLEKGGQVTVEDDLAAAEEAAAESEEPSSSSSSSGEAQTSTSSYSEGGSTSETSAPAADDYASMTNADLQAELSSRGLPTSGTKAELVARLEADDSEG